MAEAEDIGEYVSALFAQILADTQVEDIRLDRVHRVGPSANILSPDILAYVHSFPLKKRIPHKARTISRPSTSAVPGPFGNHAAEKMRVLPSDFLSP